MNGVKYMVARKIKRVVITGAGFSAPASLPVQNKIIEKMTEQPSLDFLSGNMPLESMKFLDAYITVGLFLLDNYGKEDYSDLAKEYMQLCRQKYSMNILENLKEQMPSNDLFGKNISEIKQILSFDSDSYYTSVYVLRNKIRQIIKLENIKANLEDIFTSFDKSVTSREHLHDYTYTQMNEVRYSLMRLFIYYFSKSVKEHSFVQDDYNNFFRYIKSRRTVTPTTIITTNWDTLIEEYCLRYGIKYSFGFQSPYTSADFSNFQGKSDILLLKIHGSTNWLKCLHCGSISVFEENKAAESLFKDDKHEKCVLCGKGESFTEPSLQPEIITPTMLKSLSSRIYFNLWGAASEEIRTATHIIFIGYSFPIADFDFRYMLQKNVSCDTKIEVILYKNDDPSQTDKDSLRDLLPEKRYKDAFPKNEVKFFYNGFKDYFATI